MSDDAPVQPELKVGDLRGVLPAGTTLRGYELKSILGQGAFGITYRARDTTLHRDVAIKEYLPTSLALREGRTTVLPRSPDHAEQFAWGRERFLDEARTLARLDRTPAIVRVHDFLEANGTAYMVMALVEGETLNKRLMREQRLTPEAVERLIFPLLDGLEEVHAIGFLHRDIKPANVMVDSRGRPTLIDFGAARAAMAGRSTTMTAIFTPGYAAVEQYTSAKLGPWTDVYGLAATVYHAITGRIPPSSIDRVLQDTYQPLSELKPEGYAPELLAGIDAGMARHVDHRPQSIAEWRHVLRTGEHQPSAQEATHVEHKPRRLAGAVSRSRRKPGIALTGPTLWGAVAGVLLLLAGGGYFAFVASNTGSAASNLTAEQLEQALNERRKADALAAEKKRLVEEAQRRVETDAEAKRQADAELEQARQARQKAEQELAQLKADIEAQRKAQTGQSNQQAAAEQRAAEEAAQRKAEADAVALRQAEEDAQKKAAAEADTKRRADEALAKAEAEKQRADEEAGKMAEAEEARRKADEEARQKAEADAKQKGDAAAIQKAAEANERALRLEPVDRQRLQVALTSLGFDTRGSDGVFGPRSREMIAAWQKGRNQPATGFVGAPEQKSLLKEAAAAVGKFDDDQKKVEDEKKAADEAHARTAAAAPVNIPTGGTSPTPADGLWGGTYECGREGNTSPVALKLEVRVTNGSGIWYSQDYTTNINNTTLVRRIQISIDGSNVTGRQSGMLGVPTQEFSGRIDGNSIRASNKFCTLSLTRDPSSAQFASSQFDGTYQGTLETTSGQGLRTIRVMITGSNGAGAITNTLNGDVASFTIAISPVGNVTGNGETLTRLGTGKGQRVPAEIRGDAGKDALSLLIGSERVWLPRSSTVGKLDGEQKRAADEKKAADEVRARTAAVAPINIPAVGASPTSADGLWRGTFECGLVTLRPEFRVTNGSGNWYPNISVTAANDFTLGLQISIAGSDVTAYRHRAGSGLMLTQPVSGRVDGDTIRASNKFCTLSLTRNPSAGQTASSPYDGTYDLTIPTISSGGLVTFTLRVTRDSGLVTISKAGCSTSQFDVTVSPAGEVSGQGDLKCVVSPNGVTILVGPLTIGGRIADRKAALQLFNSRADYKFVLPLSNN